MNNKGSSLIAGIIVVVLIIAGVGILAFMGFIPLSFAGDNSDSGGIDQPIGSDYCGFGVGEIVGMFENIMGKDLNNDVGFTVVNSLSMEACGSNSKLPGEIIGTYMEQFSTGWYILGDDTTVRSGYYYRTVIWGNAPLLSNSSLIRGIISGNGVTIDTWYNYETMTITSYGTKSGYLASLIWLTS